MMELRIGSSGRKEAEDEPTKGNLAGGCCFDFNKVCLHLLCRAQTGPDLLANMMTIDKACKLLLFLALYVP